jgi:excisionase family DNA binding protein
MNSRSDQMGRDPDVLTTAEVATKLGLSAQTVRRMANAGQLPALKTGKDFRYSWAAVKAALSRPHQEPGTPTYDTDEETSKTVRSLDTARRGAGYRAQRRAVAGADSTPEQTTD